MGEASLLPLGLADGAAPAQLQVLHVGGGDLRQIAEMTRGIITPVGRPVSAARTSPAGHRSALGADWPWAASSRLRSLWPARKATMSLIWVAFQLGGDCRRGEALPLGVMLFSLLFS